eukprot:32728-Chlamydomonas_euryale.AAC.2
MQRIRLSGLKGEWMHGTQTNGGGRLLDGGVPGHNDQCSVTAWHRVEGKAARELASGRRSGKCSCEWKTERCENWQVEDGAASALASGRPSGARTGKWKMEQRVHWRVEDGAAHALASGRWSGGCSGGLQTMLPGVAGKDAAYVAGGRVGGVYGEGGAECCSRQGRRWCGWQSVVAGRRVVWQGRTAVWQRRTSHAEWCGRAQSDVAGRTSHEC